MNDPPLPIDELAREQGLAGTPSDYEALATAVWDTDEALAAFHARLAQLRAGRTADLSWAERLERHRLHG